MKVCVLSADLISLHLDALFCGEDHFFLLLVLTRLLPFLLVSLLMTKLSFLYLHHRLSQA